ncbi:MAG: anti-sigma factor, partial [Ilumatobacteraceae bacterium]
MSERDDHRRDEVDDPEEPPALPAWVTHALAAPAVWADVPAGAEESIVATIRLERAGGRPIGSAPPSRRTRARVHRTWWLAAAAAVVALVAVGAVALWPSDEVGDEIAVAIAGTELQPGARAEATVEVLANGVAIRLAIDGLPPAPPGQYYQGWVRSDDGELVSVGTFHQRGGGGLVTLWSGVGIDDYPTLTVTLQQEGEGQE